MRLFAILLCVPLLAGCTGSDGGGGGYSLSEAVVAVDYNGLRDQEEPTQTVVSFDPGSRPAMAQYNDTATVRPDQYTVHDLLLDWSKHTGTPVTIEHHAAHGYRLTAIDGVVAHTTQGGSWHWALFVDGEPTTEGMGTVVVREDSEYLWRFVYSPN